MVTAQKGENHCVTHRRPFPVSGEHAAEPAGCWAGLRGSFEGAGRLEARAASRPWAAPPAGVREDLISSHLYSVWTGVWPSLGGRSLPALSSRPLLELSTCLDTLLG